MVVCVMKRNKSVERLTIWAAFAPQNIFQEILSNRFVCDGKIVYLRK